MSYAASSTRSPVWSLNPHAITPGTVVLFRWSRCALLAALGEAHAPLINYIAAHQFLALVHDIDTPSPAEPTQAYVVMIGVTPPPARAVAAFAPLLSHPAHCIAMNNGAAYVWTTFQMRVEISHAFATDAHGMRLSAAEMGRFRTTAEAHMRAQFEQVDVQRLMRDRTGPIAPRAHNFTPAVDVWMNVNAGSGISEPLVFFKDLEYVQNAMRQNEERFAAALRSAPFAAVRPPIHGSAALR